MILMIILMSRLKLPFKTNSFCFAVYELNSLQYLYFLQKQGLYYINNFVFVKQVISLLQELGQQRVGLMISLDQEIKKDKDRQYRRHRSDRRDYHHHHRYQDHNNNRKNYHSNKHQDDKYNSTRQNTKQLIKISNLHYAITKEQLQTLFSKFGKIKSCRIQWDKMGRSNETATIEFFNRQDEERAVAQMDGFQLQGQQIKAEIFSQKFNAPNKKHEITKQNNTKYKNNRYYRRN